MAETMRLRCLNGPFQGYPVGTIAYYGPSERQATKAVASVIPAEGEPVAAIKRYAGRDLMHDEKTQQQIRAFFREHGVKSILGSETTLGPHQETQR